MKRLKRAMVAAAATAVAACALRHLARKPVYRGEVEEVVAKDWKACVRRIGLRRHTPWHDRFRQSWVRLRRDV